MNGRPFAFGPENSALHFLKYVPRAFEVQNGIIVTAWAKNSGVGLLIDALGDILSNVDVVVGMADRGTSAEALAYLLNHARRTFVFHTHPQQTFHPKVYCFDDGGLPPENAALLVGSSNLTLKGLHQNVEGNLRLFLNPSTDERDLEIFSSLREEVDRILASEHCEEITDVNDIRTLLSNRHISTERKLRRQYRRKNRENAEREARDPFTGSPPPPAPRVSLPPIDVVFDADEEEVQVELEPAPIRSILWIEVPSGAVSGGSGSQIDIPNDAGRRFFGLEPGATFREEILIHYGTSEKRKPMDWRGGPGLNQQFRLNLLTQTQGGPTTYRDTVLVIELIGQDPTEINTRVLPLNHPEVARLRRASEAAGQIWETQPGRSNSRWWGML